MPYTSHLIFCILRLVFFGYGYLWWFSTNAPFVLCSVVSIFSVAMGRIYCGCAYVNADGDQKLIAKSGKCFISSNRCFWKDACDDCTKVKTRSIARPEKTAPLKIINNYFKDKEKRKSYHLKFVCFIRTVQYIMLYTLFFCSLDFCLHYLFIYLFIYLHFVKRVSKSRFR